MKTRDNQIETEVTKTLQSLDGAASVSPRPFFFTRLSARMEASVAKAKPVYSFKPAYQRITVGAVVLLLAINIFTVTLIMGSSAPTTAETSAETTFLEQYYPALTTIDNLQLNLNE